MTTHSSLISNFPVASGLDKAHLMPPCMTASQCADSDRASPYLRNACGIPGNTFTLVGTL